MILTAGEPRVRTQPRPKTKTGPAYPWTRARVARLVVSRPTREEYDNRRVRLLCFVPERWFYGGWVLWQVRNQAQRTYRFWAGNATARAYGLKECRPI